jgi:hypothetical protein
MPQYVLQDLLTDALLEINKISPADTLSTTQASIGMRRCNWMLDSWLADQLKAWQEDPWVFPLSSQQTYAMGADQVLPNFTMPRPSNVAKVNLLINNNSGQSPVRTPIKLINFEQWASISVTSVPAGYPIYAYIDYADDLSAPSTVTAGLFLPGYTYTIVSVGTTNFMAIGAASNTIGVVFVATGAGSGTGTAQSTGGVPYSNISFWTSPGANQSLELWTRHQIPQFTSLQNVITFPPGYARLILLGTAIEIAPSFGCEPSPQTLANYYKAEALVNGANAPSPLAACAAGYPGKTDLPDWNPYSGDTGQGSWPPQG